VLAKIAVADGAGWKTRMAAVEKLTDQALLAKIAVDKHKRQREQIRVAAVRNLTDQALLTQIATTKEEKLSVRLAAIGRMTDQTLLRQWGEAPQAAIRQAATRQIADDAFLIERLPTERSAAVRAAIVSTVHEKSALRAVALTAYRQSDREQALKRLKLDFLDPASDVEAAHSTLARRVDALAAETDSGKLLTLAVQGDFDVLRTAAARRLSDPNSLERAAVRATDRGVLKVLLAKLDDKAMLRRIAAAASDRAMRLAAAQKAGAKSWKEIFDDATAKRATVQMLGDALAAVSLCPKKQADAVKGVQQASLNLIGRGDESRIPEMVDLLEGYGDKWLAEDYLNCGQPDLDTTARAWARQRGYNTGIGAGSKRATWGSGR